MENPQAEKATPIRSYTSPVVTLFELTDTDPKDDCIGVIFDRVPMYDRSKIRKLCKENFPTQVGRHVRRVKFDKMVFSNPHGVCCGIRVDLVPLLEEPATINEDFRGTVDYKD